MRSLPSVCIWWLLYMSLQKSFSFLLLYRIQMCSIWIKLLVNSNRKIIVCSFAFSIVVCTVMMSWRLLETNWNCMIKELCPNRYHFWWLTCLVISTKMALTSTKQNKNIRIKFIGDSLVIFLLIEIYTRPKTMSYIGLF